METLAKTIFNINPNQYTILIVDDEPVNLGIIFEFLKEFGFKIVGANDGESALKRLDYIKPDIILLDVMMPGLNGFETCKRLKDNEATKDIPVIFLTALASVDDKVKGFQAGGVDYVTKPIKQEEILARISTHLHIRNLTQTLRHKNDDLEEMTVELTDKNKELSQYQSHLEELVDLRTAEINKINLKLQKEIEEHKQAQEQLNSYTIKLENYNIELQNTNKELHMAQEELLLSSSIFENTLEGILVTNAQGNIISVNPAFTSITGYKPDEVIKQNHQILQSDEEHRQYYQDMWRDLVSKEHWSGEIWYNKNNGEKFPAWLTINAIKDDNNLVSHYVGVFSDITIIKESEERLNFIAYHDTLTGISNRLFFQERLEKMIEDAKSKNEKLALLFIDLDRFKLVNDTLGHYVGDSILKRVAKRLIQCVSQKDILTRWGGDEFTIIISGINHYQDAEIVAQKICEQLSHSIIYKQHEIFISASIGIAIYPDNGENIETLLKNADNAMYQAKLQGKNKYLFYTKNIHIVNVDRLTLESDLRRAIVREEFQLRFQPQFDLTNNKIIGVEALLYWPIPDSDKVISPYHFIPLAEETGLIMPIGEWVLYTACKQIKTWHEQNLILDTIAVNLSTRQFQQGDLIQTIDKVIEQTSIDPTLLELEITEGLLMYDVEAAIKILQKMKNRGISIAVDDFGTGYSSLNYLQSFPIDKLKIDKSFVMDLATKPNNASIVKTIITLGHNMGMTVIAEGIETLDQLNFLKEHHCNEGQGYYYSKPITSDQVVKYFDTKG